MDSGPQSSPDPVYRSSLAEMRWILLLWAICFLWVIGYSKLYGYSPTDEPLTTVMGMPSWVFWGVILPWGVSATISCWFALTQIQDHPLDDSATGEPTDHGPSDG